MNRPAPATARFTAPNTPPAATRVEVCSRMDSVIHDSWPDSANTLSPGSSVTSRTGITVPMILGSITPVCARFARVTRSRSAGFEQHHRNPAIADRPLIGLEGRVQGNESGPQAISFLIGRDPGTDLF